MKGSRNYWSLILKYGRDRACRGSGAVPAAQAMLRLAFSWNYLLSSAACTSKE